MFLRTWSRAGNRGQDARATGTRFSGFLKTFFIDFMELFTYTELTVREISPFS